MIVIAAPVIVLLLAAVILSIEVPIVLALALILLIARFSGLIPWQVVIIDPASGVERRESHRSIWTAVTRIRSLNSDRRVKVRWAWT